MAFFGLFSKEKKETLDKGLEKSKESVLSKIGRAIAGKSTIDDEVLDNLEEALITSDVGVETTLRIIERVQERVKRDKYIGTDELNHLLVDEIATLLQENNVEDVLDFEAPLPAKPYVIMVVGVNGVGKTTTIGKLAYQYKTAGKKVYLGAADTFRAAAVEQLCLWGERVGVPVVKQQQGSDPASVVFDAIKITKERNADVLICDTAGRLQNKSNLMKELGKINKIIDREYPEAHKETLIVLDATTGQNALSQAKEFKSVTDITGIVLTKLDGTAKGGIVIAIQSELNIPVKYIGVGEGIEDLQKFDPKAFAEALF
jgi:fused signal recognition particle receptor